MSTISVRGFSYNPSAVFVRDAAASLAGGVRTLDAVHLAIARSIGVPTAAPRHEQVASGHVGAT